ncbi:MAG TPA: PPC domain-containing DNA-binding protein [Terriglobales bacterium]|nr:PPC domain-containing DNA-binding protein [Terriglobales bacterium]
MTYFVLGATYIIRLDAGDRIVESLRSLCEQDAIGAGVFHGLGAVGEAELGWFDGGAKDYRTLRIEEPCEIVSLHGNVSRLDGKPFLHCHVALADRTFGVRGGHLREAVVSATCEVVLTRYFEEFPRRKDGPTGLYLLDLKQDGD